MFQTQLAGRTDDIYSDILAQTADDVNAQLVRGVILRKDEENQITLYYAYPHIPVALSPQTGYNKGTNQHFATAKYFTAQLSA